MNEPLGAQPRSCSCGGAMEWRAQGHPSLNQGVHFCAHCDRPCTRAEMACGPCRSMKVKK